MYSSFLIKYAEIGIKGKNRYLFENALVQQIKYACKRCEGEFEVRKAEGRIYVDALTDFDYDETVDNLKTVFGISGICPMIQLEDNDFDVICKTVIDYFDKEYPDKNKTFKVFARRSRKSYPKNSMQLNADIGEVLLNAFPELKVDVHDPDICLYVEIREKVYIYSQIIPGPGGMPVGTNGKAMLLLSGGIDSPVAAFQMLKRGCSITLLHCDNYPFTEGSVEKVIQNADNLRRYSLGEEVKVYSIKFGRYLEHAQNEAPPRMTCVLCKSGMYQSAAILAKKEGANAIVDGSSIGQVASQTLNNIEATRYHCRMPTFSPLICFDKIEIEQIAKEIGTYEVSIIPDGGCSAVPRYPETHADLELVKKIVEDIKQKDILEEISETIERIDE